MLKKKNLLIISFMGVDGSGKTSLSKKIKKIFKGATYLHLKPYIFFLDKRTIVKDPHREKKITFIMSIIRLLSWLASYKIFFFINKINKVFIFDRYAHDVLIDPIRYKHNLPKVITRYILSFFPEPDLWIFLKPTLKTIKSRKSELSDSEINRQIKEYVYFFKNKKNVLMLKTSTNSQILLVKIKKKLYSLRK